MNKEMILDKALEANQKINSMKVKQSTQEQILDGENKKISSTDNHSTIKIIFTPFTMHTSEIIEEEINGITGKLPKLYAESFFLNDITYVYRDYEDNNGNWYKKRSSLGNISNKVEEHKENQKETLNMLKMHLDIISIEQIRDEYIIELSMRENDRRLNDFFENLIKVNISKLNEKEEEIQDALEEMNLKSLTLKIVIDSKSFMIKSNNINMNMVVNYDNVIRRVIQTIKMEYTEINNIGLIKLPDKVKDNAIES